MITVKFQLETLSCPSCIQRIETILNKEKGVSVAKVLFSSSKVKVEFDETVVSVDQLVEVIMKLGYPVLSKKQQKGEL